MIEHTDLLLRVSLIGIGATAVMDLWGFVAARAFGFPPLSFAMIGRWIGHMPGRFIHDSIARAAPVRGENIIGWAAHYATGIFFAALLIASAGAAWIQGPTPLPALLVGLVTVAAPFFLMQPAMGAGIASARTPNPGAARQRSLLNHMAFGTGLYAAALLLSVLLP